jgi:predicted restriction endonuclease
MMKTEKVTWTRTHLLIALNLYCKIPYGKFHNRNPMIADVAERMGRTTNSLAMKLSNFASLDPIHRARGVKGLEGASQRDRQLWNEFRENPGRLMPESEQLLHDLYTKDQEKEVDVVGAETIRVTTPSVPFVGPTETKAMVSVRRGQQFFRQAILAAYDIACCISGVNISTLLVASHIKPWRLFPDERLNLRNGLCLSAIHDAAFDQGLLTLDDQFRVVLSQNLRESMDNHEWSVFFAPYEGQKINLPNKLAEPDPMALEYHRTHIFEEL